MLQYISIQGVAGAVHCVGIIQAVDSLHAVTSSKARGELCGCGRCIALCVVACVPW